MPREDSKSIASMTEMEQSLAKVVAEILADEKLALCAAANPVLAMEEIGYAFTGDLRSSVERRLRFSPGVYNQMEALVGTLREIAGRPFNPDSPEEVDQLLFNELKLARPSLTLREQLNSSEQSLVRSDHVSEALPPQLNWTPKLKDPLEELRGAHPIMEPLLEYRRLDCSTARCAPRELYEKIKSGEVSLPVSRIKVVIKPHPRGH